MLFSAGKERHCLCIQVQRLETTGSRMHSVLIQAARDTCHYARISGYFIPGIEGDLHLSMFLVTPFFLFVF